MDIKILLFLFLVLIQFTIRKISKYLKIRPYKNEMNKNNDKSNILYWNYLNILITEENIYIQGHIINYDDISKVIVDINPLKVFLRIKICGIPVGKTIINYCIILKNNEKIYTNDHWYYFKGKYNSLADIVKDYNKNIIIKYK